MYGFYLQTDSEKVFISDQYLKYKLLNNNVPPVSLYSKDNNSEEKFFNKINEDISTVDIKTLLATFKKIINKNNIDNASAILSLNREHVLAILYLLQIGNLNKNNFLDILNSNSYYTRNELLLKNLSDSSTFDIFSRLKSAFAKKSNVKNRFEATALNKNINNIIPNFKLEPLRNVFYNGNLYYLKSSSPLLEMTDNLEFKTLESPSNSSSSSYIHTLLSEKHTPEEIFNILGSSAYGSIDFILKNISQLYKKDTYYIDGTMILADVYANLAYSWANYDFKYRLSDKEQEYNSRDEYTKVIKLLLKESFTDTFNYILYSDPRNDCKNVKSNANYHSSLFNVYFWLSLISNNKKTTDVDSDNPYKKGSRNSIHSFNDIKKYAYNGNDSIDKNNCILSSGKFLNGYGAFPFSGKTEKDLRSSILAFEGINLENTLLYLNQSDIDYMKSFINNFCTTTRVTQMSNDILISHFIKIYVYYNKHSDIKEVNSESFYLDSIDKIFAEKIIQNDFLIDDNNMLLNFGTENTVKVFSEIEKFIHENNDFNDTVESLMNTSDSRDIILENIHDIVYGYKIEKNSNPILAAYIKYILINYINYLLDESTEDSIENFQKIFVINDDFLLAYYGLLFYIRHLYLHMSDVISDVNSDDLADSILSGKIFNHDGFDSITDYAYHYFNNPDSIILNLENLDEKIVMR